MLDEGEVAAAGSPIALKKRIGGDRVQIDFRDPGDAAEALRALSLDSHGPDGTRVTVPAPDGAQSLIRVASALDAAGIAVEDLVLRRPTLDEVFLHLTA